MRRGTASGSVERLNVVRAVIVLAVAVVLGILLLNVGARPPVNGAPALAAQSVATTTTKPPSTTTTTLPPRSTIHVLVANGTSAPVAATQYSQMLQAQGWTLSPPEDTNTPVTSNSIVYYAPGEQAEAEAVASALGLKAASVQALNASVPVSSVSGNDVVVVLGPDLADKTPT